MNAREGRGRLRSLLIVTFLFFPCIARAQTQSNSESITFTTYYPSPYGSYRVLHLNPVDTVFEPQPPGKQGALYFDERENMLMYHDGTGWKKFSSSFVNIDKLVLNPTEQPDDPEIGTIYYDEEQNHAYLWNGTEWENFPPPPVEPPALSKECTIPARTYSPGVRMNILEAGCKQFCGDKGYSYESLTCSDRQTRYNTSFWTYTSFTFHNCNGDYEHTGGIETWYCVTGAKATCNCKTG